MKGGEAGRTVGENVLPKLESDLPKNATKNATLQIPTYLCRGKEGLHALRRPLRLIPALTLRLPSRQSKT